MPNDYRRALKDAARLEAEAAEQSKNVAAGNVNDAPADDLVAAGVAKGGSDVGEGNH
jgi:hypothetical protein